MNSTTLEPIVQFIEHDYPVVKIVLFSVVGVSVVVGTGIFIKYIRGLREKNMYVNPAYEERPVIHV